MRIFASFLVKDEFECSAMECSIQGSKIAVLSVYEPPSESIDLFFELMEFV